MVDVISNSMGRPDVSPSVFRRAIVKNKADLKSKKLRSSLHKEALSRAFDADLRRVLVRLMRERLLADS